MAELQQLNGRFFRSTLRQWVLCLVVCNFNVDIGPEVEFIYPPDTPFSTSDLSTICFNSFPERHDTEITEDMFYHFSLRNNSPDVNLSSPSPPYGSPDMFHGTCVFRQEYDGMTKRRFNQKSLVLISNHDFPAFFMNLLRIITSSGAISDPARLEAACSQIEAWPPPSLRKMELPFLGVMVMLEIPPNPSFPLQGLTTSASASTALLYNVSSYEPTDSWHNLLYLLPSISGLYTLYERLLLGQPVIILGQTPQHTSAMTSALIDIIRPVPYAGIVRPYLPMQSTSLSPDVNLLDPATAPQHFILGITNPFLLQRIASSARTANEPPYILALNARAPATQPDSSIVHKSNSLGRRASKYAVTRIDVPGTPIHSQQRPHHFLKADKVFLSSVSDDSSTPATTLLIRRHFADVTARLLAPVNRYLVTSSTASGSAAATEKDPAGPSPFSFSEFQHSVAQYSTPVPFSGQTSHGRHKSRDEFYSRFCESPNFHAWLDMRNVTEREAAAGMVGRGGG